MGDKHRQPERILRAMLVQISVVDAHPPLVVVLLLDEHRVSEPFGMIDFLDEPCCK